MNTNTNTNAIELLAKHLGSDAADITEARLDCYGLTVLEVGSESYAVGTDEDCDVAVISYLQDTLWACNGEFIAECCGLPIEIGVILGKYGQENCEGANDALARLVNRTCGMEHLAKQAVAQDGRGHFLASYDGDEIELGESLFAYRIG